MTSRQLFFTVLGASFFSLFVAILAPGSLRPAGRSWQLLVCNGRDCPPGWASAIIGHANSNTPEPARKTEPNKV